MTMRVFSIAHDRQGLSEVERTSANIAGVATALRSQPGVTGAMVLSTCNRVEVLLDTDGAVPNHCLRTALNEHFDAPPAWDLFLGDVALDHVFRVASGLDSMVVGEREIAGQLKRALIEAQSSGLTSFPLNIAVEEALKTSRRIARETALESAGRSVVSVGLELAGIDDWSAARVLIVGTGAYAGAVVAALRSRGVEHIDVHSASGRGAEFADSHAVGHVATLTPSLNEADLVVTCRGLGRHAVTAGGVDGPGVFLDLSLQRDVAPEVGELPGVRVIDLSTIQAAVDPAYADDTQRAEALVNQGVAEALTKLRARIIDPAVVGLREAVMAVVEDEVGRLPRRPLTHDDAALALRRLATRLLHVPSSKARTAAEEGRTGEYLHAMQELYGIGPDVDPDELETQRCPVTHLKVCDLEGANAQEAM